MKKSLLPKGFKAGYREYSITTDRELVDRLQPDHPSWDNLAGLTAPTVNLVWLQHRKPASYVRATLLHELMHVAVDMAGVQHILHEVNASNGEVDNEENYISVIGEGLYTILMDNPHLREFIFGGPAPDPASVG